MHDGNAWDINSDEDKEMTLAHDEENDDADYEDKDVIPATKSASRVLSLVDGITGKMNNLAAVHRHTHSITMYSLLLARVVSPIASL